VNGRKLVLASASPRRLALLAQIGLTPDRVHPTEIDETPLPRELPRTHAERLAREAPGAELMLDPDGTHGLTNHAFESRSKMADWLAAHL